MFVLTLPVSKDSRLDPVVVSAAAKGEPSSFQLIFNKYLPLIKHVWRAFRVEGLEYEDWCQESCLIISKVLCRYQEDSDCKFGALLKLSLIRRANDLYRERVSLKRIPQEALVPLEDITEILLINHPDSYVEGLIESKQGFQAFWSSCSPFERKVFAGLHCGQSMEELAHRFGCKPKTVRNAMYRCHHKMKVMLDY